MSSERVTDSRTFADVEPELRDSIRLLRDENHRLREQLKPRERTSVFVVEQQYAETEKGWFLLLATATNDIRSAEQSLQYWRITQPRSTFRLSEFKLVRVESLNQ
jgi:hypothetical protein